jgi:hypothetical protein
MNSWTYLLIAHGLLAVALLGAITHQVVSVLAPARRPAGSFVARFRSVPAPSYAGAVVVLYILAFVFGAIIYTEYRISVRTVVEQLGMSSPAEVRARTVLTALLAFIVWWNFLVGHILNNVRGFGS